MRSRTDSVLSERSGSSRPSARSPSLVASGASNRDIADALFVSPKTVSVHVSALLRKFELSGRGDLRTPAGLNTPHE